MVVLNKAFCHTYIAMTVVKISQFNMPTVEVLREFFIFSDFFSKMHYLITTH